MYYIYHIPNYVWKDGRIGKIGCTTNLKERVKKQQGYTDYEILEEHTCIDTVSKRELELQEEYGYPIDTVPYKKVYHQRKNTSSLEARTKGGITQGNINKKNGHIYKLGKQNVESGKLHIARQLAIKVCSVPVLQYDKEGNFIKEWESQASAARYYGIYQGNINKVVVGKRQTCGGFIWKYKENNLELSK